jgi:hypothetical protein
VRLRNAWRGRPDPKVTFHGSDAYLIPFSVLWAGFAFFWEWGVVHDDQSDWFLALWGIPFVLIGV